MGKMIEEGRQELKEILIRLASGENFSASLAQLEEFAVRYGNEVLFTFLDEFLETEQGTLLRVTCMIVIKCDSRVNRRNQAVAALEKIIRTGTLEERLQAVYILFDCKAISEEFVPVLASLLKTVPADDLRRLWVAGAIFLGADPEGEHEELREEAMWLLFDAQESSNSDAVLFAAMALSHEKVESPESCRALLMNCEVATTPERIIIVGQLGKIGANQPGVVKALIAMAGSTSEAEGVRLSAIISLMHVKAASSAVNGMLLQLMHDPSRTIVLQAAGTLQHRQGQIPDAALEILVSRLNHPDATFRGASALLLMDIPGACGCAVPTLLKALEQEEDEEIAETMVVAIGYGGESALQLVAETIESADLSRLPRYQYAFSELTRHHVQAAARYLGHNNHRIRQSAAWALNNLGIAAHEAIPILNPLLESHDPRQVRDVLIALQRIGVRGADYAHNLAKLLSSTDETTRRYAEAILVSIGAGAVPALQELRNSVNQQEQAAIDRCLAQLHRLHQTQEVVSSGVDGVTNETDLELFCHVADLLMESGALSLRSLKSELVKRKRAGAIREDLPCSDAKIGMLIRELEECWSQAVGYPIKLIDRSSTKKGGLTEEGQRYLRKTREYLERLRNARSR